MYGRVSVLAAADEEPHWKGDGLMFYIPLRL